MRGKEMGRKKMSGIHLNGTCANCKSRFRFIAEEILGQTNIHCPHCNCTLDPTYLKAMAQALLKTRPI